MNTTNPTGSGPHQPNPHAVRPPEGWAGGQITPRATCVLCPNPSPMTLDGTNTWILAEPDSTQAVVVDPGPLDQGHLDAVIAATQARGLTVTLTLLTHSHPDHAQGAARFAEMTRAPVHALGPGHTDLRAGQHLNVGGLELRVIHTPGHTRDSTCFLLPAENSLLTGDTVLGWGTTVVAWPDGNLQDYLATLADLDMMAGGGDVVRLLPGHGHAIEDAVGKVTYYREHRDERLDQIREAITVTGSRDADDVVATVYADVPRQLWPAARLSVLAQLDYLRDWEPASR